MDFNVKLHKILKDPDLRPQVSRFINRTKNVGIREYKIEIPVDKGIARTSVSAKSEKNGFVISSTAQRGGFLYPVAVHEGTYSFRGSKDYGRRSVTRSPSSYLDAGGKGIRPNKFVDRARATTMAFANKELRTLSKDFERTF